MICVTIYSFTINNMIPPKTFYFIRHGQTDYNLNNILQGSLDIPLNAKGIAQAEALRNVMNKVKISKIFASPLKRARCTAEIINENVKLEIEYVSELKERHWGEWEGKNKSELPIKSHLSKLKDNELPKGAETFTEFLDRARQALTYILSKNDAPLIVAHAGIFKALCYILSKEDLATDNCQLYEFKVIDNDHYLINRIE